MRSWPEAGGKQSFNRRFTTMLIARLTSVHQIADTVALAAGHSQAHRRESAFIGG
jgi:hypothetical protein